MVVEKLITRAKRAIAVETDGTPKNVHARRESFSFLHDHKAVSSLFNDIAPKVGARPGGYTRVVKLGQRQGDGAELAVLELVDYNLAQEASAQKQATKASRPRRRKGAAKSSKEGTTDKNLSAGEQSPPASEEANAGAGSSSESVKKKKDEK